MRRVRRRGGNKEKVFGCDLLEHLTASCQEIPQVLRCCSEFVENHGIVDGIYRLSGVSSNIQKLRSEFESDGNPDLNKDVYLQDIHCVSSLCKAYFRELPNPLLTYQLYDKFAEAVAIQLEEERLVKIRDVLKELPPQHYRTLEFLMLHLVRMASYSSETNMHARNLAIVWAPNLLRSKDIEATGFNGTAAFMEVRVQSIVVEFILTHVPQLFPEQGETSERRKSLPSPTAASIHNDTLFKSVPTQPITSFGNISPGDGPLPIRPYHAIIEGTDKRKGSLKGRKWMSIFNIGGRFQDQRRRHKHSPKEKDRTALRPARSMDSLSAPSYPNEGSRRSAQRPPSTNMSSLVTPSPQSGSEVVGSCGAIGGSEYAVTYRRGTGLVSGGAGTQGTYTALDPEGLGITGNETVQSRSPGLSTKAGRRAAMHITGPTLVTVPLHITSNLALGVLQGGGSNRVIHCGRDKDGWDKVEGKEGADKVERKESSEMEMKVEEGRKAGDEEKDREGDLDMEGNTVAAGGVGEEKGEGANEEEKKEEEVTEDCRWNPEPVMEGGAVSREQRTTSLNSNVDNEDAANDYQYADDINEYMVMKGVEQPYPQPVATQPGDVCAPDASDIVNSTQVEGDDQAVFGYLEDNFEFLDQMDCSVPDHMDCSSFYQVNEFSVEPPGHSDDEYEVMIQPHHPAELEMHPETQTQNQNELNPHRPLSLDLHSRHTKSLSLPYMTSPVQGPEESFSEEEDVGDNSDDNDYSSEEDESMFIKSLPPDFFLNNMTEFEQDTDTQDSCTLDGLPVDQSKSSEEREFETLHSKEPTTGDLEQGEVVHDEDKDELVGKQIMKKEGEDIFDKQGDQPEKHMQSITAEEDLSTSENVQSDEEKPPASEVSPHCCVDFPLPSNDNIDELGTIKHKEEKEVVDSPNSDYPPRHTGCPTQEIGDVSLEESRGQRHSDEEEDRRSYNKEEATFQEMVLEIKESDENMLDDPPEEGDEGTADKNEGDEGIADKNDEEKLQEDGKEQDSRIHSNEIWEEADVVRCEVTEDEECEQAEGAAEQGDVENVREENEEQKAQVSGDKTVEVEEGGTNGTEVRTEVEEESVERAEEQLTDLEMQQEFEEKGTCLPETSELEKAVIGKHATNEEAQHHDRKEVVSKEPEKENNDNERGDEQPRSLPSVDKQLKKARPDTKKLKCEESESSQGGVGRKLVVSKHPKIYQVKAVPIVPPKPQHCKITALTLRQQQQQRERRDADRGRENTLRVPTEQDKVCPAEQGKDGGEKERRRDGDEGVARDTSRNSPHSMCFDEAVAIATMRREKEKECEKEKERQRDWGSEVQ